MDFSLIRQIQILPFDTSCREEKYLVCYKNRYFEVSTSLAELICTLQCNDSLEKAAASFFQKNGKIYSDEEFSAICEKFISPIINNQNDVPHDKPRKNKTFIFQVGIIPPEIVKVVASHLQFFMRPLVALVLLFFILACEMLFFFTSDLGGIHSLSGTNVYVIIGVLCLFVMGSLFHEMGHATACRRFNADNGGIGCGLYISFPVLYTDVTNIWKLTRKQRIIVNVSGVYFQLIFLLPFFVIYFLTQHNIARLFIYAINLNLLITLNPFFKFDGYWIMSDLVGVPNLRQRSMEYFVYLFKRVRRKEATKPFLHSIKPIERFFMIIYSLVVNIFFLYFFAYGMPLIIYNFITVFPVNAKLILDDISRGIWPESSLIIGSVFQIVFFWFILTFLYKMLIKLIKTAQSKKSTVQA